MREEGDGRTQEKKEVKERRMDGGMERFSKGVRCVVLEGSRRLGAKVGTKEGKK